MAHQLTDKQRAHFWARVDIDPDRACWTWHGTVLRNGYGQVKFNGKRYLAHRLAFELWSGLPLPERRQVLHAPLVCHNRRCCNPAHMRLGTAADNARDRAIDGTAAYQRPGKYAPHSKLGMAGAVLARFLVHLGNTHAAVADWLSVSRPAVSLAMAGRTWPMN